MEEKKLRVYNKIWLKLKEAKRIALVSHLNPDGDTIGSSTALFEAIKSNFYFKKIDLICLDDIPAKFSFLAHTNKFKKSFDYHNYDLIIFLDISNLSLTWFDKFYPSFLSIDDFNTISIDHHVTNKIFARQNLVISNYSSTTMIIYEFLKSVWAKINKNTATSILTGIYTDTWWLKHSNTNSLTLKYCSELLDLKADKQSIIDNIFYNNSLDTVKLWWSLLQKSFINNDILYTYISKTDLDNFWVDYDSISWVIDYLNMVEWIKYSVTLTQKWDFVKWSLRTLRDDIDVSKLAVKYWWWWHKKASWFTRQWQLCEIKTLKF